MVRTASRWQQFTHVKLDLQGDTLKAIQILGADGSSLATVKTDGMDLMFPKSPSADAASLGDVLLTLRGAARDDEDLPADSRRLLEDWADLQNNAAKYAARLKRVEALKNEMTDARCKPPLDYGTRAVCALRTTLPDSCAPDSASCPIDPLLQRVSLYPEFATAMAGARDLATKTTVVISDTALPFVTAQPLTQERFATTYFTPVVGVAAVAPGSGSRTAITPYMGVQVFPYANPIDEPMWSNGGIDALRLFGAEIGFRPAAPEFGENAQYRAYVYLGGVIQPLPYATLGLGYFFLGRRSFNDPSAKYETSGAFTITASIQANIPDFIRARTGGKSSAK